MLKPNDRDPAEGEAVMTDDTNNVQLHQQPPEPSADLESLDRLIGT